jgi:hypothetical protein
VSSHPQTSAPEIKADEIFPKHAEWSKGEISGTKQQESQLIIRVEGVFHSVATGMQMAGNC